jgi:APA family basic amino acid/polyamine antiporter
VSSHTHVPVAAIATQGILAVGFALFNSYDRLLGYTVFADWIFFALAGVALIIFRRTRADAPRPYKTPLYPFVPLLFTLAGAGIVLNLFVDDPVNAITGSAIIAIGVPVFFIWRRFRIT